MVPPIQVLSNFFIFANVKYVKWYFNVFLFAFSFLWVRFSTFSYIKKIFLSLLASLFSIDAIVINEIYTSLQKDYKCYSSFWSFYSLSGFEIMSFVECMKNEQLEGEDRPHETSWCLKGVLIIEGYPVG